MLQQTTVKSVLSYYKKWMRLFPDIKALSLASMQRVLRAWQGLGYYQRAKNLHKASQIIMREFGGKIPQDYEALIKLPGFGPYTAAAVLSIAFHKRYPLIDANIRRISMRLKGLYDVADTKNDKSLIQFLSSYFPKNDFGQFNQAMMELGALVCRPNNPKCLLCPITEYCKAYKKGFQDIIPRPKKRNYRKIETVVGIITKQGKYLIQKRPSKGLLGDLWEFPGGKKKRNESLKAALHREIQEELNTEVSREKFLIKVHHSYTQFQVTLHAFECILRKSPESNNKIHRWVTLKGLKRYPFPAGNTKIIKFLEKKESIPRSIHAND